MKVSAVASTARGDAIREHGHDLIEVVVAEIAIRVCAPQYLKQLALRPFLGGAHGDDLLCQHIEWRLRDDECVEFARLNGSYQRCAFNQFVAGGGKDASSGYGTPPV